VRRNLAAETARRSSTPQHRLDRKGREPKLSSPNLQHRRLITITRRSALPPVDALIHQPRWLAGALETPAHYHAIRLLRLSRPHHRSALSRTPRPAHGGGHWQSSVAVGQVVGAQARSSNCSQIGRLVEERRSCRRPTRSAAWKAASASCKTRRPSRGARMASALTQDQGWLRRPGDRPPSNSGAAVPPAALRQQPPSGHGRCSSAAIASNALRQRCIVAPAQSFGSAVLGRLCPRTGQAALCAAVFARASGLWARGSPGPSQSIHGSRQPTPGAGISREGSGDWFWRKARDPVTHLRERRRKITLTTTPRDTVKTNPLASVQR